MSLKLAPTLALIASILLLLVAPVPAANAGVGGCTGNLQVTKANNVGGSTTVGTSWTWTITLKEVGNICVFFSNTSVIFRDDLPNANISYGDPVVANNVNITNPGNIDCAITGNTLTCTANGGFVGFDPISSVDVTFTATAKAAGTFSNPTAGGTCKINPDGDANLEATMGDNDCNTDTVTVLPVPGGDCKGSVTVTDGEPYYLDGCYGQVFVQDETTTVANGGNHLRGNVTVAGDGADVCALAPPGYLATSLTCQPKPNGGGRVDLGILEAAPSGTNGSSATGAAITGFLIGPGGGEFGCSNAIVLVPQGVVSSDTFFLCDAVEEATSGQSAFGYSLFAV